MQPVKSHNVIFFKSSQIDNLRRLPSKHSAVLTLSKIGEIIGNTAIQIFFLT